MPDGPSFERFRRTILREGEPDRVPVAELLVEPEIKEAFLGRPVRSFEDDVEFWVEAGYDYVPLQMGLIGVGKVLAEASTVIKAAYGVFGGGERARTWSTTPVITSMEDYERFPWPTVDQLDWSQFEAASRLLPAGMKVVAVGGKIFQGTWNLMGMDRFAIALVENPDLVGAVMGRIGALQWETFRRAVEFECVGGVWNADDIAYSNGLMVHPKHLRQHLYPWYRRMGEVCRERGLVYIYHTDGCAYKAVEDLIACGFHALHPIEPKAMDIVRMKREYGDRLALIGNLDLGYTLTRGTPEEVEAEVRQRIEDVAPGGGYAVSSSNSVTEYVPLANFNAMREATFKYGRYPIRQRETARQP